MVRAVVLFTIYFYGIKSVPCGAAASTGFSSFDHGGAAGSLGPRWIYDKDITESIPHPDISLPYNPDPFVPSQDEALSPPLPLHRRSESHDEADKPSDDPPPKQAMKKFPPKGLRVGQALLCPHLAAVRTLPAEIRNVVPGGTDTVPPPWNVGAGIPRKGNRYLKSAFNHYIETGCKRYCRCGVRPDPQKPGQFLRTLTCNPPHGYYGEEEKDKIHTAAIRACSQICVCGAILTGGGNEMSRVGGIPRSQWWAFKDIGTRGSRRYPDKLLSNLPFDVDDRMAYRPRGSQWPWGLIGPNHAVGIGGADWLSRRKLTKYTEWQLRYAALGGVQNMMALNPESEEAMFLYGPLEPGGLPPTVGRQAERALWFSEGEINGLADYNFDLWDDSDWELPIDDGNYTYDDSGEGDLFPDKVHKRRRRRRRLVKRTLHSKKTELKKKKKKKLKKKRGNMSKRRNLKKKSKRDVSIWEPPPKVQSIKPSTAAKQTRRSRTSLAKRMENMTLPPTNLLTDRQVTCFSFNVMRFNVDPTNRTLIPGGTDKVAPPWNIYEDATHKDHLRDTYDFYISAGCYRFCTCEHRKDGTEHLWCTVPRLAQFRNKEFRESQLTAIAHCPNICMCIGVIRTSTGEATPVYSKNSMFEPNWNGYDDLSFHPSLLVGPAYTPWGNNPKPWIRAEIDRYTDLLNGQIVAHWPWILDLIHPPPQIKKVPMHYMNSMIRGDKIEWMLRGQAVGIAKELFAVDPTAAEPFILYGINGGPEPPMLEHENAKYLWYGSRMAQFFGVGRKGEESLGGPQDGDEEELRKRMKRWQRERRRERRKKGKKSRNRKKTKRKRKNKGTKTSQEEAIELHRRDTFEAALSSALLSHLEL